MSWRVVPVAAVVALVGGVIGLRSAGADRADCFAEYGGVVGADDVVPGDLEVTRQNPPVDPMGLDRGTVCVIEGTVDGSVSVVDDSHACASRPPFTAVELAGGVVWGDVTSAGKGCAMVWLQDGSWRDGTRPSMVQGDVVIEAPGNLGFLGSDAGAIVEGDAILRASGSELFAAGASNENRVEGELVCEAGAPAGGAGTGTDSNWDGLEDPEDPGPDGTVLGGYRC